MKNTFVNVLSFLDDALDVILTGLYNQCKKRPFTAMALVLAGAIITCSSMVAPGTFTTILSTPSMCSVSSVESNTITISSRHHTGKKATSSPEVTKSSNVVTNSSNVVTNSSNVVAKLIARKAATIANSTLMFNETCDINAVTDKNNYTEVPVVISETSDDIETQGLAKYFHKRPFFDKFPSDQHGKYKVYFFSDKSVGAYIEMEYMKQINEFFLFKKVLNRFGYVFPYSKLKGITRFTIEGCEGPGTFDLKMTLFNDPKVKKQKRVFYSWRNFKN